MRRTPLLTTVAVIGAFLVGGATAPAGAGVARLTKGKVEKIAAQVVAAQAPSLKVAHATTATTADRALTAADSSLLAGKPASDYRTSVWTEGTLALRGNPVKSGKSLTWVFDDLPVGTYLLDYDLVFDRSESSTGNITCSGSVNTNPAHFEPQSWAESATRTISGSVLASVGTDGRKVRLGCSVASGWLQIADAKQLVSRITLTRVDDVHAAAVTVTAAD